MSEFYGWLQGSRGETTRCGTKSSGIGTTLQGCENKIVCDLSRVGENDVLYISTTKSSYGSGERKLKFVLNDIDLSKEDLEILQKNSKEFREFLDNIKILKAL